MYKNSDLSDSKMLNRQVARQPGARTARLSARLKRFVAERAASEGVCAGGGVEAPDSAGDAAGEARPAVAGGARWAGSAGVGRIAGVYDVPAAVSQSS